jgi:hypothetical protein
MTMIDIGMGRECRKERWSFGIQVPGLIFLWMTLWVGDVIDDSVERWEEE